MHKNYDKLHEEQIHKSFGPIYDGIDLENNRKAIYKPFNFLMRRLILVTILYFMRDESLYMKIIPLFIVQYSIMLYNIIVRPCENESDHFFENKNDWTIMITLYYLCCFTDYIPDPNVRYNIGWSLIVLQTGATILSLTLLIVYFFKSLYKAGKQIFKFLRRCKKNGCKYVPK